MKVRHDAQGRLRLWFDADEIEQITADALKSAGLWPTRAGEPIDIEGFVENHLRADVDYAGDLERDVLGYTEFRKPPLVVVNRRLTDLASAPAAALGLVGRWRATIAHEASHILLHTRLYDPGQVSPKQKWVRCLRVEIKAGTQARDWREVQANMGMAALLLPQDLLLERVKVLFGAREPLFPPFDPRSDVGRWLTETLAAEFFVSRQATALRLINFGLLRAPVEGRLSIGTT